MDFLVIKLIKLIWSKLESVYLLSVKVFLLYIKLFLWVVDIDGCGNVLFFMLQ